MTDRFDLFPTWLFFFPFFPSSFFFFPLLVDVGAKAQKRIAISDRQVIQLLANPTSLRAIDAPLLLE